MTGSVSPLWPTRVWTGCISSLDPGSDAFRAELADAADTLADLGTPVPAWTSEIQAWNYGRHEPFSQSPGRLRALAVLNASDGPHAELRLYDPRTGAANVGLPGLPWGRPHTLALTPGTAVVTPAWLAWQILPPPSLQTLTLWRGYA